MNPLIASILNNPGKHQVNRDYKMSKTIDVMTDNMAKQEAEKAKATALTGKDNKGYGEGRKMGD